ncbi:Phospholipid-transporting ATPase 1 [Hordeum vulgare]|nr:Phospholipid-transporting ATPase 1 [Hordeum vulgare]
MALPESPCASTTQSIPGFHVYMKSSHLSGECSPEVGLDLDDFPPVHVFSDEYDLEEEDEVDIDGKPLFKDELANQAVGVQHKRKRRRTKAYTKVEDKLLCIPRFGGIPCPTQSKSFNLSHCWRIIKDEEKFKLKYTALITHEGKEVVEGVGEGEKPWMRGKTNSKKDDKGMRRRSP